MSDTINILGVDYPLLPVAEIPEGAFCVSVQGGMSTAIFNEDKTEFLGILPVEYSVAMDILTKP